MNNTEINIMFQLKEVYSLNTEKNPCIDEKDYSFTKCLMEYVKRETNCNLEFFTKKNDITTFCRECLSDHQS